ncbi:MAG: hypothetical protein V3W20_01025 [Candidatus Neomarinimicrobiota bacterium]
MYKRFLGVIVVLMLIPLVASATWQIADPLHGIKSGYLYSSRLSRTDHPQRYANGKLVLFKLRKGLLKDNILRFAKKYNWRVTWRVANNYYVMLNTKMVGPKFRVVMDQLLAHYSLYASYNTYSKRMVVYKKPSTR